MKEQSQVKVLSAEARRVYVEAVKEGFVDKRFPQPLTKKRFLSQHGYYDTEEFKDALRAYTKALKLHIASVLHYDVLVCQNAQTFLRYAGVPPTWKTANLETNASCEAWLRKHEIEAFYCYWKLDKYEMLKAFCHSDDKTVRILAKKLLLPPADMISDIDEDIRIEALNSLESPNDIKKLLTLKDNEKSPRVKRFIDRHIAKIRFRETAYLNLKKKLAASRGKN